jgi:hypothetical protein
VTYPLPGTTPLLPRKSTCPILTFSPCPPFLSLQTWWCRARANLRGPSHTFESSDQSDRSRCRCKVSPFLRAISFLLESFEPKRTERSITFSRRIVPAATRLSNLGATVMLRTPTTKCEPTLSVKRVIDHIAYGTVTRQAWQKLRWTSFECAGLFFTLTL